MNNEQLHNKFLGDDKLPINIPSPADAWSDMRKRLDDEMPETVILLPGNIITAGTGFINSITALFTLLLASTIVWWFSNNKSTTIILNEQSSKHGITQQNKSNTNNSLTGNNAIAGTIKQNKAVTFNTRQQNNVLQRSFAQRQITINNQNAVKDSAKADETINPVINKKGSDSLLAFLNKPLTKAAPPVVPNKTDSTADTNKDEKDTISKISLLAGLQWNAQLPFSGTKQYFSGPNGSSQPYKILLPGAWVAVEIDKSIFLGEINPFATTVYHPKAFAIINQTNGQALVTQTKQLNKVFGLSAAIRYDYNIGGNWWAGAGIEASWLHKALATTNTEVDNGGTKTYYSTVNSISDSDWAYLSKFRVRTDAELFYHAIHWRAGIRAGVYFSTIAKRYDGPKNPLEFELFYRWVLWNKKR